MLLANLSTPDEWMLILQHPVWRDSMKWLIDHSSSADIGIYKLGIDGWYANVHQYLTRPSEECIWESHRLTIDIQLITSGKERILSAPSTSLLDPTRYISHADRQEWKSVDMSLSVPTTLEMHPGNFAIFLPNEGHCPMIAIGEPLLIRKTVIKIPSKLFLDNDLET
jgi:biofilm protein TabA